MRPVQALRAALHLRARRCYLNPISSLYFLLRCPYSSSALRTFNGRNARVPSTPRENLRSWTLPQSLFFPSHCLDAALFVVPGFCIRSGKFTAPLVRKFFWSPLDEEKPLRWRGGSGVHYRTLVSSFVLRTIQDLLTFASHPSFFSAA